MTPKVKSTESRTRFRFCTPTPIRSPKEVALDEFLVLFRSSRRPRANRLSMMERRPTQAGLPVPQDMGGAQRCRGGRSGAWPHRRCRGAVGRSRREHPGPRSPLPHPQSCWRTVGGPLQGPHAARGRSAYQRQDALAGGTGSFPKARRYAPRRAARTRSFPRIEILMADHAYRISPGATEGREAPRLPSRRPGLHRLARAGGR